jgi:hypothetical protein
MGTTRFTAIRRFVAATAVAMSAAASAVAVNVGETIVVNWDYFNMHGVGTFTLNSMAGGVATFGVNISNTSTVQGVSSPRLTAFGFNTDNLSSASITQVAGAGDFDPGWGLGLGSQNLSGGFNNLTFCAYTGNNCSAGGNAANSLSIGQYDSFTLTLTYANTALGIVNFIDNVGTGDDGSTANGIMAVKFINGPDGNSFEFSNGSGPGSGGNDPLPVPGIVWLLGLGVAAMGARKHFK